MRRDVGGHADGDARRAVHEQVGEARRQDLGLGEGLVVVGLPVDGVLLEVAEELHRGLGESALGVAHGRGGVSVDVAEVAVAVDQRRAHGEPLGETNHRVVDGGVSVRVVLADDLADRPGRLLVRAVGEDARLVHGVEDAAVDGLQAVAHVGEGARGDDGHRVLDEALAHLVAELGDLEGPAVLVGLAGFLSAPCLAELLLELAVVLVLGVLRLLVGVVDVLALVGGLRSVEQAPQVLGEVARGLGRVVHVVCHVGPFSGVQKGQSLLHKFLVCKSDCPFCTPRREVTTRRGIGRRARGARCSRGGTRPGCP